MQNTNFLVEPAVPTSQTRPNYTCTFWLGYNLRSVLNENHPNCTQLNTDLENNQSQNIVTFKQSVKNPIFLTFGRQCASMTTMWSDSEQLV